MCKKFSCELVYDTSWYSSIQQVAVEPIVQLEQVKYDNVIHSKDEWRMSGPVGCSLTVGLLMVEEVMCSHGTLYLVVLSKEKWVYGLYLGNSYLKGKCS